MNDISRLFIFFIFFMLSCSLEPKNNLIPKEQVVKLETEIDTIVKQSIIKVDRFKESDWINRFSNVISKRAPNLRISKKDSINYWFVPAIIIPINLLEKDKINFLEYLDKGEVSFEQSEVYITKSKKPIIRMRASKSQKIMPFSIVETGEVLENRDISIAQESELYFSFYVKYKKGYFIFGGLFYYTDDGFYFINYSDNKVYPGDEIFRTHYDNEEDFRKYINKLVEFYNTDDGQRVMKIE